MKSFLETSNREAYLGIYKPATRVFFLSLFSCNFDELFFVYIRLAAIAVSCNGRMSLVSQFVAMKTVSFGAKAKG